MTSVSFGGGLLSRLNHRWVTVLLADSVRSRTRKPNFELGYMAATWLVTVMDTVPFEVLVLVDDAAVPVVAGWLFQVAPLSVHEVAARKASMVRPLVPDLLVTVSVAEVTEHPAGTVGSVKFTRVRWLSLTPDWMNRSPLLPLVLVGEPWST